jgi:hypothetical protein
MLLLPPKLQVFAALAPTDMRKSFTGLEGIVETHLRKQLEEGDLFLFFNRRRDRLKVLFFTGDGTVILYKRLERGTFEPLRVASRGTMGDSAENCLTLSLEELRLLLEGIELSSIKRRARWHRNTSSSPSASPSASSSTESTPSLLTVEK